MAIMFHTQAIEATIDALHHDSGRTKSDIAQRLTELEGVDVTLEDAERWLDVFCEITFSAGFQQGEPNWLDLVRFLCSLGTASRPGFVKVANQQLTAHPITAALSASTIRQKAEAELAEREAQLAALEEQLVNTEPGPLYEALEAGKGALMGRIGAMKYIIKQSGG